MAGDFLASLSGFHVTLLPQNASFCSAECSALLQSFNCTTNASYAGNYLSIKRGSASKKTYLGLEDACASQTRH